MYYHAKSRVLSQVLTHTMHVSTHADSPVHVEEACRWLADEYKKETGRDVREDFPLWEPCHRLLLTHGIMGYENVGGDIDKVTGKRCTIIGLPIRWVGGDGSIVEKS